MSEVVYPFACPDRTGEGTGSSSISEAESTPVIFGVHSAVAEHYKVPSTIFEPHAPTFDYIVAAAAG